MITLITVLLTTFLSFIGSDVKINNLALICITIVDVTLIVTILPLLMKG